MIRNVLFSATEILLISKIDFNAGNFSRTFFPNLKTIRTIIDKNLRELLKQMLGLIAFSGSLCYHWVRSSRTWSNRERAFWTTDIPFVMQLIHRLLSILLLFHHWQKGKVESNCASRCVCFAYHLEATDRYKRKKFCSVIWTSVEERRNIRRGMDS